VRKNLRVSEDLEGEANNYQTLQNFVIHELRDDPRNTLYPGRYTGTPVKLRGDKTQSEYTTIMTAETFK
jgi:hypothetical protein